MVHKEDIACSLDRAEGKRVEAVFVASEVLGWCTLCGHALEARVSISPSAERAREQRTIENGGKRRERGISPHIAQMTSADDDWNLMFDSGNVFIEASPSTRIKGNISLLSHVRERLYLLTVVVGGDSWSHALTDSRATTCA